MFSRRLNPDRLVAGNLQAMFDNLEAAANALPSGAFAQGQVGRREIHSQPKIGLFAKKANPFTMVPMGPLFVIQDSILKAGNSVAALAANNDGKFHAGALVEAYVRTCGLSNDPADQTYMPASYFGLAVSNDNGATFTPMTGTIRPLGLCNGGQYCINPNANVIHYIFGTSTGWNRSPVDDPIVLVAGIGGNTSHTVMDHSDVSNLAVAIYCDADISTRRLSFDISLNARRLTL